MKALLITTFGIAAGICAVFCLAACTGKSPLSSERTPTQAPTEAPVQTDQPEPTECPGQHGDFEVVMINDKGERNEIPAYGRPICSSTKYADGTMVEADGGTLPYFYRSVRGNIPEIKAGPKIYLAPPNGQGYSSDPVESVTAYKETAEGKLETFREFDDPEAFERFINNEWDARDELIVEIIVRFTDRSDQSNGSVSSGLDGWSIRFTP